MYSPWAPRTRGKVILSLLRKAFACNTMALGLKDLRGSPQGLQTRWQREWNGMTLLSSPESFCFLTHSTKQPFHTHIPHFYATPDLFKDFDGLIEKLSPSPFWTC